VGAEGSEGSDRAAAGDGTPETAAEHATLDPAGETEPAGGAPATSPPEPGTDVTSEYERADEAPAEEADEPSPADADDQPPVS
jgi:hypothetical protein